MDPEPPKLIAFDRIEPRGGRRKGGTTRAARRGWDCACRKGSSSSTRRRGGCRRNWTSSARGSGARWRCVPPRWKRTAPNARSPGSSRRSSGVSGAPAIREAVERCLASASGVAGRGISQRHAFEQPGAHGGGRAAHGGCRRGRRDLHRRSADRPARSHRRQRGPGARRSAGGRLPHARPVRPLARRRVARAQSCRASTATLDEAKLRRSAG